VHGSSETICCRVSDLDCLLSGLELGDGAHWAKDLLLNNFHVLGDVTEDGWLDEVALVSLALAANFNFGAGLFAVVNVAIATQLANDYR